MAGLLGANGAAVGDSFPNTQCPVSGSVVVAPLGPTYVAVPCRRSCPWFLGVQPDGAPLCAVRALGLVALDFARAAEVSDPKSAAT